MSILPLPTSRVSDYLARTRLAQQTQSDQLELFRVQNQISTGRRIFSPSEDGASALRAITLQRSLERKDQLQVNLRSAQSSLTSADSSLNEVATILNNTRADALGVAGTTATDEQRLTTRTDVLAALERLVGFGNSTYQDTFLFAGSRSLTSPYTYNGSYVEYSGNEANQLRNVDAGIIFDTNIPGDDVFGGLSEPVRGGRDLNPHVTSKTLLSDLNDGQGVTAGGSIEISFVPFATTTETERAVIDLSTAPHSGRRCATHRSQRPAHRAIAGEHHRSGFDHWYTAGIGDAWQRGRARGCGRWYGGRAWDSLRNTANHRCRSGSWPQHSGYHATGGLDWNQVTGPAFFAGGQQ